MRVPCSASSRAARSASVKAVASRQAATRLRRTEVSPACAASLVCMSTQTAQPLIWLARISTRWRVAAGSVESDTTLAAETRYFTTLAPTGLPWWAKRASMLISFSWLLLLHRRNSPAECEPPECDLRFPPVPARRPRPDERDFGLIGLLH